DRDDAVDVCEDHRDVERPEGRLVRERKKQARSSDGDGEADGELLALRRLPAPGAELQAFDELGAELPRELLTTALRRRRQLERAEIQLGGRGVRLDESQ